ncbi:hypothetical protein V2J09_006195 [Rumex salicifolius]
MATTLSLLKIPAISCKSQSAMPCSKLQLTHCNPTHLTCRATQEKEPLQDSIHILKSGSLPALYAITLPFFLDTKASIGLSGSHYIYLMFSVLGFDCFNPQDALAAGGEFGIFEGRSFALIHPLAMGGLFVYTLWAGYLGWQWRRVRTSQDEINELKKQVKPVAVTPDGTPDPSPPSPIQTKIQELTEERKKLLKGNFRDRHFNAGSILLGFGVLESVGGALNTWLRTGKLFPGPHLFAGAAITVLWATAAALVPPMQKGNETARNLHIALNAVNVALFVWQIPTGFDIVLKALSSVRDGSVVLKSLAFVVATDMTLLVPRCITFA